MLLFTHIVWQQSMILGADVILPRSAIRNTNCLKHDPPLWQPCQNVCGIRVSTCQTYHLHHFRKRMNHAKCTIQTLPSIQLILKSCEAFQHLAKSNNEGSEQQSFNSFLPRNRYVVQLNTISKIDLLTSINESYIASTRKWFTSNWNKTFVMLKGFLFQSVSKLQRTQRTTVMDIYLTQSQWSCRQASCTSSTLEVPFRIVA